MDIQHTSLFQAGSGRNLIVNHSRIITAVEYQRRSQISFTDLYGIDVIYNQKRR